MMRLEPLAIAFLTESSQKFPPRFCTVMFMKIRKFYAVRVEDLKPISGEQLSETCDPDEFVYLVDREGHLVHLIEVHIALEPELREAA
jgi:hypothetical protein